MLNTARASGPGTLPASSRIGAAFIEPVGEAAGSLGGQRRAPLFPALSRAPDVGAGAETDVGGGERSELGYPQPGLGGEQDEGVVAAAVPGAASEAASRASSSSRVRKHTRVLAARLAGMARTRVISAACSGTRSEA